MDYISYEDFTKVDLRSGIVVRAEPFERARNSSYKVWVDFGDEIGIKQTSAQITKHYTPESLVGKVVVGCINLAPKNIAGFMSEFLLVGFSDAEGHIYLVHGDSNVPRGKKLH